MRRVAPFALVALLLASAYPMLTAQEEREPIQRQPLPNPAASGAIFMDPPAAGAVTGRLP